jgi:hypothetical protein
MGCEWGIDKMVRICLRREGERTREDDEQGFRYNVCEGSHLGQQGYHAVPPARTDCAYPHSKFR